LTKQQLHWYGGVKTKTEVLKKYTIVIPFEVVKMETVPAKVTEKLLAELDRVVEEGWYANRSEAIRDAIRELVEKMKIERLETAIKEDIEWGLRG